MSDENVDLVRRGYEAYAARDFAAVFARLAPDVEIAQTAELPWGGTFRGHAAAQRFFRLLAEYTEAVPMPETFIAAGDDVAVVGRLRGRVRATQAPIDLPLVHVWTVQANRIVRFAAYVDTAAMVAALAGPPASMPDATGDAVS